MWIGTDDGLNRYDGYNFKIFRPQPEDSLSISYHGFLSIVEDKNKNLWIGTANGVNRYDREHEKFIRYFGDEADNIDYPSWRINKLFLDSRGNLWLGTREGAYTYDYEKDSFIKYSPFKESPFEVRDIEELADGRLAFVTERGLLLLDIATLEFVYMKSASDGSGLRSENVPENSSGCFGKSLDCPES